MSNEIRGVTIVFEGQTVSLDRSITSLNNGLKALKGEFKNLNSQLKLDPTSIEKVNKVITNLEQQQKVVNERIAVYKEELAEIEKSAGGLGSKEWLKLKEEINKNEAALNKLNKELEYFQNYDLNRLNNQFKEFGKNLQDAGDKVENVGKALLPVSAGATAALGGATYAAIEFESAFAGVEKTVDATAEQLDELSEGIRDLALEIPATTTEISAVAEAAGQLGIETENILDFTKTMIGLGEATNLTSDEAATMIAQFANVTGLEGDYDRLGSAIVALGNNGASTEKDILELAQRLSGAASTASISEQDILALAASMANLGINAEAGGSAMSKFISTIEAEVAKGSKKMEQFATISGMSADEFKDSWEKEPAKVIGEFIDGLGEIEKNGGSAIVTLEELGISEIRQRDALLRLANAEGEVAKNIELANMAWSENSALSNETTKRYATTESQLAILKNTLNELALTFGELILPYVNSFVTTLQSLLTAFTMLSPGVQQFMLIGTALVAALAPLLLTFGKILNVVGLITESLGTAGLAGSFTAIAGPIAAAIGLFAVLYTTSEEFRTALSDFLIPVIEKLHAFLNDYIIPILTTLWDWIKAYVVPVIISMTEAIGEGLATALYGISDLFIGLIDILMVAFDWFVTLWEWLDDLGVWKLFAGILDTVAGVIEKVVGWLSNLFGWLGKVTSAIGSFLSKFAELAGKVGDGISNVIGGFFSGGFGDIQSGGFSGNLNLTTNITVNTSREITQDDTRKWAMSMVDVINEELGALM